MQKMSFHPHNACHMKDAQYVTTSCICRVILVENIFSIEKGASVLSITLSHLSIYALWLSS
jgi:hypothetical protein